MKAETHECSSCEGSGMVDDPCAQGATDCETCDGMGKVPTWDEAA